jgi:hypothetical protein
MADMSAQRPAADTELALSAMRNGLAGLLLTVGFGWGLSRVLGLDGTMVPKAVAAYGMVLLILVRFLPLHRPHARLGPANQVTLVRAVLTSLLAALLGEAGTAALAWTALALTAPRADLAAALAETGRGSASAFVRSPTLGGNSWLAHASLLSGLEVTEGGDYDLLLTQPRETLVHRFARAGYRTLAVMPGLRQAWPEGAFYGFDAILGAQALDYRGPALGWWRIPDQFALARLDSDELTDAAGRPRLAVFPTINSHIPFRPTPPYQPDWGRLLAPDPFDPADIAACVSRTPTVSDLPDAYTDSLAYLFRVLAGWLHHRPDMDLVLLVLGDHQPPAIASGEGSPWDIPVHLITGRAALTDALVAQGLAPGLTLRRPALRVPDQVNMSAVILRNQPRANWTSMALVRASALAGERPPAPGTSTILPSFSS